jgi:hypothetical protein
MTTQLQKISTKTQSEDLNLKNMNEQKKKQKDTPLNKDSKEQEPDYHTPTLTKEEDEFLNQQLEKALDDSGSISENEEDEPETTRPENLDQLAVLNSLLKTYEPENINNNIFTKEDLEKYRRLQEIDRKYKVLSNNENISNSVKSTLRSNLKPEYKDLLIDKPNDNQNNNFSINPIITPYARNTAIKSLSERPISSNINFGYNPNSNVDNANINRFNANEENREININRPREGNNNPGGNGSSNGDNDPDDPGNDSNINNVDDKFFNILEVKEKTLFNFLKQFIKIGSHLQQLSITDIRIQYHLSFGEVEDRNNFRFDNLKLMMKHGNKLLDSIIYLTGENKDIVDVEFIPADVELNTIHPMELARNAFLLYFYVVVQGFGPHEVSFIPGIIRNLFGISINEFVDRTGILASFNLRKLDYQWIKAINIDELGNEIRNRIALGIAGHRYVKAIALNPPKKTTSIRQKVVFNIVYSLYKHGLRWELHPVFKSHAGLAAVSLNKNLINFMFDIYTSQELDEMKFARLIPNVILTRDKSVLDYRTWSIDIFDNVKSSVLRFGQSDQIILSPFYTINEIDLQLSTRLYYLNDQDIIDIHEVVNLNRLQLDHR